MRKGRVITHAYDSKVFIETLSRLLGDSNETVE